MYGWAAIVFLVLILAAVILRLMGVAWITLEVIWILFIIGLALLIAFLIARRASSAAQEQNHRDKT